MKAQPPHIMRMVNELSELTERIEGLAKFMATPAARALPSLELKLMSHQATGMMLYSKALPDRLGLAVKR